MTLTPLVFWAQRHKNIYLRVDLTDATNIDIHIHENVLLFKAQGFGAKGQNECEFRLEFLSPVKPEVNYKSTQRQINITLEKEQHGWWERLVVQERKPVFLAPDFDRWLDESDAEMDIHEKEEERKNLKALRHKKEGFVSLKTGYLFIYNLVQFLSFSWIFVNMTVRLFILGEDPGSSGSPQRCFWHIVRTGVVPTLIQVFGRSFILFVIFGCIEEMHNRPVVFFVFYLWSAIEIFRYPFYMLGCFNTEWKTLTWLRYTVWIPLYPLGVLAEAVAVVQSIPIFYKTEFLSIPLPKSIGTSINFSYVLYVYLILMFLGLFSNFRHLYKQRKRRFRTKKRKAY